MESEYGVYRKAERKCGDRISRGEVTASAYRLRPHSKNQRTSNLAEDGNGAEMGGIGAE